MDFALDGTAIAVRDVAEDVELAESVSTAMLLVLETLAPTERAVFVLREVFDLPGFSAQVDELDSVVPTAVQAALLLEIRRLLDRAVRWLVTSRRGSIDVGAEIERFRDVVAAWAPRMAEVLTGGERERLLADADAYAEDGVPQELALRTAGLLELYSLLDVVDIAHDTQEVVEDVVPLYFGLSEEFGIDVNLIKVSRLPREELWDAMARAEAQGADLLLIDTAGLGPRDRALAALLDQMLALTGIATLGAPPVLLAFLAAGAVLLGPAAWGWVRHATGHEAFPIAHHRHDKKATDARPAEKADGPDPDFVI